MTHVFPAWSSVLSSLVFLLYVPSRKAVAVRCPWAALSGNGWTGCPWVTADPLKSTSPGSGSGGKPWWLFCFLPHFLQHLKTRPVIYILPDTRINTINKSSLMPLCSDKCNSSSSCCHIHRNLPSQRSLLLMLCRWERKSFAVFFKSQYHRTVLALQIPNLGDPCEECPSCCHLSPSCNGTFSCLWESRIRRTFQ